MANYSNNDISVVNIATNTVSNIISVGTNPIGIAFTPDGTKAYVANTGSSNVSVINVATSIVSTTVTVGSGAIGVSVTPDGTKAYVSSNGANTVSVIDTSTDTVSTTVTVGHEPNAIGFSIQPPTYSTGADMPIPQGRLTLSSTLPVMTADATAQTTIYYLPYQGNIVPVYSGAAFVNQLLSSSGISLALDSNSVHTGYQANGSLFDIFAFMNSGILTLGTGPAWTNSTTRSAVITQVNGIWTNSAAITLRFGSASGNTVSVSTNQATYLGTMYATANGQTGVSFQPSAIAGGTNNIVGLFNAYNRIRKNATCQDANTYWTYASSTVRNADNSSSNRISYVDGLQVINIEAKYLCSMLTATSGLCAFIAIGLNSSAVASTGNVGLVTGPAQLEAQGVALISPYPSLGFNYVQALEYTQNAGTASYALDAKMALVLTTEY